MNRANQLGAFMSRKQQRSGVDNVYLVSVATTESYPFFKDFLAGRLLVDILRQQQHRADTWAYLIMPNQLDWLFELKPGMSRYKLIEKVLSSSSYVINGYLSRRGVFWQEEYAVRSMISEAEAQGVARALVARPKRCGLVQRVADYPLWDARHWF